jgi:N-acetylglucosaminyldiphosphoundecaprenol N-acetyl-beta-D-mannosaminyltransferase
VLGGLELHAVTQAQCVGFVGQQLAAGCGGFIATANIDHLWRLRRDAAFRAAYAAATLRVADGMPLLWASRVQGTPLPGRVAGSDLIHTLSAAAARDGRAVFLLGGNPGTAERAAERLAEQAPGLRIAGTFCPPFGFDRDPQQMAALRERLANSRADIVFVALGAPKQEFLIHALHTVLPAAWWIGVGISFSFVTGEVQRAPRWLQRLGLEWLHRLLQEPRRLAKRYLWYGPPVVVRLLGGALWRRFGGAQRA